jgi:hypothetical protein
MSSRVNRLATAILGAPFALLVGVAVALAAAANPLIGTWHLNVAKSKFRTSPPPKSAIAAVTTSKDGQISVHLSIVNADGKKGEFQYTASYDGKDYPMTGSQVFDAISLKRIDDHTDEVIYKKKGKVIRTSKRTISNDGKTLIITDEAPDGKSASAVSVWDRQ